MSTSHGPGEQSSQDRASGIMSQKIGFRVRPVLLSNGEHVQGEAALQGHTMSSSTSERSASRAGAMKASANRSKRVFLVLWSSSSDEESAEQAHIARHAGS